MDEPLSEQGYVDAKSWLAEVLYYFDRGVVMSPQIYEKYQDLIDRTKAQIAEYEARQATPGDPPPM